MSLSESEKDSKDLFKKLSAYDLVPNVPANIEFVSVSRALHISSKVPTESPLSPRSSKLIK